MGVVPALGRVEHTTHRVECVAHTNQSRSHVLREECVGESVADLPGHVEESGDGTGQLQTEAAEDATVLPVHSLLKTLPLDVHEGLMLLLHVHQLLDVHVHQLSVAGVGYHPRHHR